VTGSVVGQNWASNSPFNEKVDRIVLTSTNLLKQYFSINRTFRIICSTIDN